MPRDLRRGTGERERERENEREMTVEKCSTINPPV
jgi:hypothetical protein